MLPGNRSLLVSGPYTPDDWLIGPMVASLADIISNQITGIDKVYQQDPDGSPLNNSVTITLHKFKVEDDTNGKLQLRIIFAITHWFRRSNYGQGIAKAYSYIMPYLLTFSAWPNQQLGHLARIMQVSEGGVTQLKYANEPHVGLVI